MPSSHQSTSVDQLAPAAVATAVRSTAEQRLIAPALRWILPGLVPFAALWLVFLRTNRPNVYDGIGEVVGMDLPAPLR
jgi:hypothetical protein